MKIAIRDSVIALMVFGAVLLLYSFLKDGGEVMNPFSVQLNRMACDCKHLPHETKDESTRLLGRFCSFDGDTKESSIGNCLDSLRAFTSPRVAMVLSSRLRENDPLYRHRGLKPCTRIRSYILASLGGMDVPPEALPYIVAELKYDSHIDLMPIAAAARAARGLTQYQQQVAPLLAAFLDPSQMDDYFDLDNYNALPPKTPTTIRKEVLHTLIHYGRLAAPALPELQTALASAGESVYSRDAKLRLLVSTAIDNIQTGATVSICASSGTTNSALVFADSWRAPQERVDQDIAGFKLTDFNGDERSFAEFKGKPFVLTFFYTRCDNYNKCSMTVSALGELHRLLNASQLESRFYLLGLTLDPTYDTPLNMKSFAEARGAVAEDITLLRASNVEESQLLTARLGTAVSYQMAGLVSVHGVEILLFDKRGLFVRRFANINGDPAQLINDLKKLDAEIVR